ncbi:glycosyltransferase [Eubacterium oxidoreducens]|uniref:Glycosyltransferase involved in cell wall bisynthesis n=1 Tax=Eubacterium oxidoreducens TaxID=1732 RepID=A0A1G6AEG2_EUBOX|nr:glycosyltransferase [Eubacterium oxidoreducens]SDB06710.1 Glycosyltransferase involved in cell wall bisynthesis [Eubacterium oxidoreducens]
MRKRVLVIMPSMFIGGAEKSLLGLLEKFDKERFEIMLFLFRHEGELMDYIPKDVPLLGQIQEYTTFDRPIKDLLKSSLMKYGLARLKSKKALAKYCKETGEEAEVWKSMQYTSKYVSKLLGPIPGSYDLAISFLGVPFYMDKVDAKVKMAWVHTDYHSLKPNRELDREAYSKVDYVVNVSKKCEAAFLEFYPELKDKSLTIENVLPKALIELQEKEEIKPLKGAVKLLSIGRYSEAKNFDNVPDILKRIRKKGVDATWYIIGYGKEEQLIKDKIREANVEEYVILLGKKANPYPYIKACDLYVQPSRWEGKCVSVIEAQLLHKPVVITAYETSSVQLINGEDGIVVPMDNEGCAQGIVDVINNKQLMEDLVANTYLHDYTNAEQLEKIYKLME